MNTEEIYQQIRIEEGQKAIAKSRGEYDVVRWHQQSIDALRAKLPGRK